MTSVLRQAAIHALVALVLSAATVAAYDRLFAPPPLRVGLVDLQAVYREKEAEFTRRVTAAATEDERAQALQSARVFAQELAAALDALPGECGCLVVQRSAVAGPGPDTPDLTPLLRRKVGLP